MSGKLEVKNEGYVPQPGILIEVREPGIVVVVAIDLDWGAILAHSAPFTYVAKTKILAGNNCNQ